MPAQVNSCLISTYTQTHHFERLEDDTKPLSECFTSDDEAGETSCGKVRFETSDFSFSSSLKEKYSRPVPKVSEASKSDEVCSFESLPEAEKHERFFRNAFEVLLNDGVFKATARENKVNEWVNPEELEEKLELGLNAGPSNHEKLIELMRTVIQYSVKTGHPYFVNQLFSR